MTGIMQMIKDIATKTDGLKTKVNGIISKIIAKWHMVKHYHIALKIMDNI